jgi:hypothetical protein
MRSGGASGCEEAHVIFAVRITVENSPSDQQSRQAGSSRYYPRVPTRAPFFPIRNASHLVTHASAINGIQRSDIYPMPIVNEHDGVAFLYTMADTKFGREDDASFRINLQVVDMTPLQDKPHRRRLLTRGCQIPEIEASDMNVHTSNNAQAFVSIFSLPSFTGLLTT